MGWGSLASAYAEGNSGVLMAPKSGSHSEMRGLVFCRCLLSLALGLSPGERRDLPSSSQKGRPPHSSSEGRFRPLGRGCGGGAPQYLLPQTLITSTHREAALRVSEVSNG